MYCKLLFVFLAVVLAACQGAPLFGPTPTPFPDTFEGKATVGDNTLTIWCEGSGEPTIILEKWDGERLGLSITISVLGRSPVPVPISG